MNNQPKNSQNIVLSDEREEQVIKKDLYRVLGLYTLFLALVLVLYFTNKSSGYMDAWFAKVLHF